MDVRFLLAEEARPELHGKLSVLGFFPGDVIVIIKGDLPEGVPVDTPSGMDRLTVLAVITGAPDGIHKFRVATFDPSGKVHRPETVIGEGKTETGLSHTVLIDFKPFIIPMAGMYKLEFFVDDQKFSYAFEVREQKSLPAA